MSSAMRMASSMRVSTICDSGTVLMTSPLTKIWPLPLPDATHARHAGTTLSSHDLAAAYGVTDVDGSQPDCWRLIAEHGFDHGHVDVTGYR